jgi:drug/metabolite transporter (DMT)-like permease
MLRPFPAPEPCLSAADRSDHARGLLLTAIGGMALTVDIPLIRLSDGEPWSILMVRCGTTLAASLLLWLVLRRTMREPPPLVPGRSGAVVAALYAISSMTFITAVYNTSTANLVFILAFNTMFAALLSWLFLKERPRPATLIAMAAMLVGVLVIVGDGISSGHLFGDLMAFASAFCIAAAITVTRASGKNMGFTALVAVVLPFVVALFMVWQTGFHIAVPGWIVFNGSVIMPLSFFCLASGPRYLSGPEVAMFYLLETVLAPVWVWLIFAEVPSRESLVGGTILIVSLVAHSLWQLHDGRRRRAAAAIRHPV